MEVTHAQLVKAAHRWGMGTAGCKFGFSEFVSFGKSDESVNMEYPDWIGFKRKNGRIQSVVVECKVSRSDFKADAKKPSRSSEECALGSFRFYLVPQALIWPSEIHEDWGLLFAVPIEHSDREFRIEVKKKPRGWNGDDGEPFDCRVNELQLLYDALKRMKDKSLFDAMFK
jgi:hypothetical protein